MADFIYGSKSAGRIATCHVKMQDVAMRAIKLTPVDYTIIHGWRGEEVQTVLFESGASKKPWPESEHNHEEDEGDGVLMPCSLAIDFGVLINGKIPWKDTHAFAVVAGVWFAAAEELGATLRWGGDWDMDGSTEDQTFMDWGHMEIRL
jgi:peptidoglycan L-alanyl-D-glutamate endopeptidase CwlK